MAAKKPIRTMRAPAAKPSKAAPSGAPVPVAPPPTPDPIPEPPKLPTPEEIAKAEEELAAAKAKLWALLNPVIPYPKWVEGIVVDSPEEEAAVLAGTAKTVEIKQAENTRTVIVKGK